MIETVANMENEQEFDVADIGETYVIISKDSKDILNEMDFADEDEYLTCESIINNLEKQIAAEIRNMKVVSIPYIGCLRINPVRRKLRDAKLHLSLMRKNLSKSEYKQHVRDIVHEFAQEMDKSDKEKLIMTKIRRNNKKRYEEYRKKLGKGYAEMFIKSIRFLSIIEHDEDFEEYYRELKAKEEVTIGNNNYGEQFEHRQAH